MTESIRPDATARHALRSDFDSTFFVEAGAGTGKTTAMVDRIVGLVTSGRVSVEHLVAITFTEAAAAELRTKIRDGLEDARRMEGEPARLAQEALASLDRAALQTIHAFAGSLLRTYPLEAGLPPDFETLDPIVQQADVEQRFAEWFEDLPAESPQGKDVSLALLLGLKPKNLQAAAQELHSHYDLLEGCDTWETAEKPSGEVALANGVGERLEELQSLLSYCHEPDGLHALVGSLAFRAGRLCQARTQREALGALLSIEKLKMPGTQKNWGLLASGTNACKEIKEILAGVNCATEDMLGLYRQWVLGRVLASLREMTLEFAAERKRDGRAHFHDLLAWTRDLLYSNQDVRHRVQERWQRIIVDEFQDTDPLQMEIALVLSADPDWDPAGGLQTARIVPGKLCLVGDPKQSIYRFRQADMAVYEAAQEAIERSGGEVLHLQDNFRSTAGIIEFVNDHFQGVMIREDRVQPPYVELGVQRERGAAIRTVGGSVDGTQPDVWQKEAEAVASFARTAIDEKWAVSDRESAGREAHFKDVCILIPSRTNLRRLEEAFEALSVPYRFESGELILLTQEVHDLLSCLRVIDDPSDQVALVAAIRSPIYGCSDPELLEWVRQSGRLNYVHPGRGEVPSIIGAFDNLRRFHEMALDMSFTSLVEAFLDDRLLLAAPFDERKPRESWRRYRYVVDKARAFSKTGRANLRTFIDWMEGLQRDPNPEVAGPMSDDEDAVRVLTVHVAKGLEFPIVILTGLGSRHDFRSPKLLAGRRERRVEVRPQDGWQTSRWDQLYEREKLLDSAEYIRLMYVAATRARDHLVLSLFRKGEGDQTQARAFAETVAARQDVVPMDLAIGDEAPRAERPDDSAQTVEDHRHDEELWQEERTDEIDRLARLHFTSASALSGEPDDEELRQRDDVAQYRHGRGGTSLGRAVHAVLQVIPLDHPDESVQALSRAQAEAEGIPGEASRVAELVLVACASEPVRRVVQSGRYWREVPVGGPVNGGILEGFIDLLGQDGGGVVVVDYKTDAVRSSEIDARMHHYRLQGAAYSLLVRQATGREVTRVEFVFLTAGETRTVDGLGEAEEEVKEAIRRPASAGDWPPGRSPS